jgi:hypothetical protein
MMSFLCGSNYKPLRSPDQQWGLAIYCLEHHFLVAAAFGEERLQEEERIALRFGANRGWVDLADSSSGHGVRWALALVSQDPK